MNKFNFISNSYPASSNPKRAVVLDKPKPTVEGRALSVIRLSFSGQMPVNIVSDDTVERVQDDGVIRRVSGFERASSRTSPIVKSEIQESLKQQFKIINETVVKDNQQILFFKMNKVTQNKLRCFLSYEVDYVPSSLRGKGISGMVNGIGIILDDEMEDFTILPMIKYLSKQRFIQEAKV